MEMKSATLSPKAEQENKAADEQPINSPANPLTPIPNAV
jgi:hypothetical protein